MCPSVSEIADDEVVGADSGDRMGEKLPRRDPPDVVAARSESRREVQGRCGGGRLVRREVAPGPLCAAERMVAGRDDGRRDDSGSRRGRRQARPDEDTSSAGERHMPLEEQQRAQTDHRQADGAGDPSERVPCCALAVVSRYDDRVHVQQRRHRGGDRSRHENDDARTHAACCGRQRGRARVRTGTRRARPGSGRARSSRRARPRRHRRQNAKAAFACRRDARTTSARHAERKSAASPSG